MSDDTPGGAPPARETEDESILPLLREVLHGLEQQSGQWFETFIGATLAGLFSPAVRSALQTQLNETTRTLTEDIFSALPTDEESSAELQERTERLIREMIDEMLNDIFEGSVRSDVEYHTDEAAGALRRLELDVAARHGQEALEALLLDIVGVLGRRWGDILRLLVKVVIEFLQETISSSMSEGFTSVLSAVSAVQDASEQEERVQEKFKEKADELGEQLRKASETLRQRVAEQTEELRSRVKEGMEQGTAGHQLGKPPAGRKLGLTPNGRPPSARPPSGATPSRSGRRQ